MLKKINKRDRREVEIQFTTGSSFPISIVNAYSGGLEENDFRIAASTSLNDLVETRTSQSLSAAAAYGFVDRYSRDLYGLPVKKYYGKTDTVMRFFTAFASGGYTKVPIAYVNPAQDSRLYNVVSSSFTVEFKWMPEKPAGPNDGIVLTTLTRSAAISKSFIDCDIVSFLSCGQADIADDAWGDLGWGDYPYGYGSTLPNTASMHFRLAGDKAEMPVELTNIGTTASFHGHAKPVLEVFGLRNQGEAGAGGPADQGDNLFASVSRDDDSPAGVQPFWRRVGAVSGAGGYIASCSNWHYTYITWHTGSWEAWSTAKFDQYGLTNTNIGGVRVYNRDSDGNSHLATASRADPGQLPQLNTASWASVTGSDNFRTLGGMVGTIQVGSLSRSLGSGFTDAFEVRDFVEVVTGSNPFYGAFRELRIWEGALDHQTLLTWSNKELDKTHPNAESLVGYWKFDFLNPVVSTIGNGESDDQMPAGNYSFSLRDLSGQGNPMTVVFLPHSGSGPIPNNDSSSFTAMTKAFSDVITGSLTDSDESTHIKKVTFDNPIYIRAAKHDYVGDGLVTGSFFKFSIKDIVTCPIVDGTKDGSVALHQSKYPHLTASTDGIELIDRTGKNRVLRPYIYSITPGTESRSVIKSLKWQEDGSGSIDPPLKTPNKGASGFVGYQDGIFVLRDGTYSTMHNLYVHSASYLSYPTSSNTLATTASIVDKWDANLEFEGTLNTKQLQYLCRIGYDEFNASTNPTFAEETGRFRLFNTQSVTYITAVGLYDDDNNLLGVAHLAKPLRKENDMSLSIKLRIDT